MVYTDQITITLTISFRFQCITKKMNIQRRFKLKAQHERNESKCDSVPLKSIHLKAQHKRNRKLSQPNQPDPQSRYHYFPNSRIEKPGCPSEHNLFLWTMTTTILCCCAIPSVSGDAALRSRERQSSSS